MQHNEERKWKENKKKGCLSELKKELHSLNVADSRAHLRRQLKDIANGTEWKIMVFDKSSESVSPWIILLSFVHIHSYKYSGLMIGHLHNWSIMW